METPGDQERPRVLWASIAVGAFVGLIIAVAGPMLVSWFQSREPKLVYSAPETIPFQGQTRTVATYQVSISNDGRRSVEDVSCVVSVRGATIEQRLISPSNASIVYLDSVAGDSIKIQLPSLNPSEAVQVSVLASAANGLPNTPSVSLRARGVVGERRAPRPVPEPWWREFAVIFIELLLIAGLWVVYRFRIFPRVLRLERKMAVVDRHYEEMRAENLLDQRLNLAYLCRLNGLASDADGYLRQSHAASYWSEADRLGMLAEESNDTALQQKVTAVLQAVLEYADPGDYSRAIVSYNLARLAKKRGDQSGMKVLLGDAVKLAPGVVCTRIGLDPVFRDESWAVELARSDKQSTAATA